jgi:small subunit ribosomal protein S21
MCVFWCNFGRWSGLSDDCKGKNAISRDFSSRMSKCEICWKRRHLGRLGGVFNLAEVRVQEGEPLENALRRFKRKVQTEDIIKEVKRHSFYLKPGEKKRVKEALARKRNRKKVRKEQD